MIEVSIVTTLRTSMPVLSLQARCLAGSVRVTVTVPDALALPVFGVSSHDRRRTNDTRVVDNGAEIANGAIRVCRDISRPVNHL